MFIIFDVSIIFIFITIIRGGALMIQNKKKKKLQMELLDKIKSDLNIFFNNYINWNYFNNAYYRLSYLVSTWLIICGANLWTNYLIFLQNIPETYIIGAILFLIVWIIISRIRKKYAIASLNADGKVIPRFRKRDKLYFYGRKMLRTVRGSIQARSSELNAIKSKKLARLLPKG